MDQQSHEPSALAANLDALIVGAGAAGLYMLHILRGRGFRARIFEAGGGVGGTWYWNRYPGARCDVESMEYCYNFSDELRDEWEWSERYSPQPEILRYLNHVADRFDLRPDIQFDTRVKSAVFDEAGNYWIIETDTGASLTATHCVMATGCLSAANRPQFDGLDNFAGPVYQTGRWPHEGVDFTGKRVGIIGTGSSAVQAIPLIARQAEHLTVFQRTPNYVVPAHNHDLDPGLQAAFKANAGNIRALARQSFGGFLFLMNPRSALEATPEEREQTYETRWNHGGIPFMGSFNDLGVNLESNKTAQEFFRRKIHQIVNDPATAALLSPDNVVGCKRICVGTGYYETYNRENVTLVDVSATPIGAFSSRGVTVGEGLYEFDELVLATGFDAMTGALSRIDIRGRNGLTLQDKWGAGPRTYLGLAMSGFPNLFTITGPGSPSVLSNMLPTIEQHVEWIADCITFLRDNGVSTIEAERGVEDAWVDHVNDVASKTLRYACNSWYLGVNIPGKPRIFMPYIGGMPAYRQKCDEVAAAGYAGFQLTNAVDVVQPANR